MKKTVTIIITLAIALTVFATACGNAGAPPADSREPRPLENDFEVARGSSSDLTGGLDTKYSGITLDDLNQLTESDGANFKVQAISTDGWASTADQSPINTYSGLSK